MSFRRCLLIVTAIAPLAACAARNVTPMRISQEGDTALSCVEISRQMRGNRAEAAKYLKDDRLVEQQNTALTVVGLLPWMGLLTSAMTNFSNQDQIRARALIDREERLAYLAKQKECGT